MKKHIVLAALMTALASPALAQGVAVSPAPMTMPMTSEGYRQMSLISDSFEIQTSSLALERSRNPRVRRHAQMMIQHHSMTTQMLLPAARVSGGVGTGSGALVGAGVGALVAGPVGAVVGAGVGAASGAATGTAAADATGSVGGQAPIVVAQLDARHAAMLAQLQGLQGASFDAAYGQMQYASHQEALAMHTAYAQSGTDPNLRAFAAQTAPVVEQHLAMSQRLPGVRNRAR
jgi:predicted outer membrane protein